MAESKKYFYLKLKENFFDREEVKLLESQENGYIYSNLYLKLCLLSLKAEGKLCFKKDIPYDEKMLSILTGIDVDHVRAGVTLSHRLGLITKVCSGEMFVTDIQDMIGHSSTAAERKRKYREKLINIEGNSSGSGTMSQACPQSVPDLSDKVGRLCLPEIRDKRLDININTPVISDAGKPVKKSIKQNKIRSPEEQELFKSIDSWFRTLDDYPPGTHGKQRANIYMIIDRLKNKETINRYLVTFEQLVNSKKLGNLTSKEVLPSVLLRAWVWEKVSAVARGNDVP